MTSLFLAALITSFIAGRPIPVTCAPIVSNHAGYYDTRRDAITLSPFVCAGFAAPPASRAKAVAVYSLAHESEHAAGILDEHQADCATVAVFQSVIRRLGLTPKLLPWAQKIHDSFPAPYSGACA